MKILVTGATGFVGSRLLLALARDSDTSLVVTARDDKVRFSTAIRQVITQDLSARPDWREAVAGADAVVHLAARVHVMRDRSADPLAEFRRANVHATQVLAEQAARAGVRRFLFVSSIKVNGEETALGAPFLAEDAPNPQDSYGISKHEAEMRLREVCANSGMEFVIIRPPLVYGPGVKANFRSMMSWLHHGIPLPFGAVMHNRRSFVALDNLVDFIAVCLRHPAAKDQVFLVSDGDDLSTTQLLRRMAFALNCSPRLIPVPLSVLEFGARLTGRWDLMSRLCGSLQVDSSKARDIMGWVAPISVDHALADTARDFLERAGS